jgi:hypothetical protein
MRLYVALALVALLGTSSTNAKASPQYSRCASDPDPPVCLVDMVAARTPGADEVVDAENVMAAAVVAGSVELVLRHRKRIIEGARAKLWSADRFMAALGLKIREGDAREAETHSTRTFLAALVLLTASIRSDDPYKHPIVRSLMAEAGSAPAVNALALTLWYEIIIGGDLGGRIQPRGLPRVWDEVLKSPYASTATGRLGSFAWYMGFPNASLQLLKVTMADPQASNDAKASASSALARYFHLDGPIQQHYDAGGFDPKHWHLPGIRLEIAVARLARGYDASAVRVIEDHAKRAIEREAFHLDRELLAALEKGGARDVLIGLADLYLQHARSSQANAFDRSNWYEHASDCYRRAGRIEQALSAAREGMRIVSVAMSAWAGIPVPAGEAETRRARVQASGRGTGPARALYRAGAREEAIASGYLWSHDRYELATETGEPVDPKWAVDEHSTWSLKLFTFHLLYTRDVKIARRLDDLLGGCEYVANPHEDYELYGVIAALAGREDKMKFCFARSAHFVERPRTPEDRNGSAYSALELAIAWRLGELVLPAPSD